MDSAGSMLGGIRSIGATAGGTAGECLYVDGSSLHFANGDTQVDIDLSITTSICLDVLDLLDCDSAENSLI